MSRAALLLAPIILLPVLLAGCLTPGDTLVGKPAPSFEVTTLDGRTVSLEDYRGKPLILDLMATWCGPCKEEIAHLREVQRAYGDGVAILSIGVDPTETPEQLRAFKEEYGSEWDMAPDRDGIGRKYGLQIIPLLVVVGADGTVLFAQQGVVHPATLAQVLGGDALQVSEPFPWARVALAGAAGAAAALLPPLYVERLAELRRSRGAPATRGLASGSLVAATLLLATLAALAWHFSWVASKLGRGLPLAAGAGALAAGAYALWRGERAEPPSRAAQYAAAGSPLQRARAAFGAGGDWLTSGAPYAAVAVLLSLQGLTGLHRGAPLAGLVAGFWAAAYLMAAAPEPTGSARRHRAVAAATSIAAGAGLLAWFLTRG